MKDKPNQVLEGNRRQSSRFVLTFFRRPESRGRETPFRRRPQHRRWANDDEESWIAGKRRLR
jgi:hypothetical protein